MRKLLAAVLCLAACRPPADPSEDDELLLQAKTLAFQNPSEAITRLEESSRSPQVLEAMRPTLRELIRLEAWDPNAAMLHRYLWDHGLRDAEMTAWEERIYRATQTGKEALGYFTAARSKFGAAIVGDLLIFPHSLSRFGALDLKNKSVLWADPIDIHIPIQSDLLAAGGRIYFATRSGRLHCRDSKDMKEIWNKQIASSFSEPPFLAADGENVYALWEDDGCQIEAHDLKTGELKWGPLRTGGRRAAGLAVGGKFIVTATWIPSPLLSELTLHDPESGRAVSAASLEGRCQGIAVAGEKIFAALEEELVAVAARTGAEIWRRRASGPIRFPPAVVSAAVVTAGAALDIFQLTTGAEMARVQEEVASPPVGSNGEVYAVRPDGHIFRFTLGGPRHEFREHVEAPTALSPLLHDGHLIVSTKHGAKIHVMITGDRKAGGWTQTGGGPGKLNAPSKRE